MPALLMREKLIASQKSTSKPSDLPYNRSTTQAAPNPYKHHDSNPNPGLGFDIVILG